MDTPIVKFPGFIEELSEEFRPLFQQERSYVQFKRAISGITISEHPNIANINGLFLEHTDQSNLNRFVNSDSWSEHEVNRTRFGMINRVEKDGVVILDDYIIEKCGPNIYGTDYHHDHSKGRSVFGQNIVDCAFSGDGIFPLLQTQYLRKGSKWKTDNKHLTKIDIQKQHLSQLVDLGLNFKWVTFDCWYLCKSLTDHIESVEKNWIGQVKSNRLVRVDGKWIPVKKFAESIFPHKSFKTAKIGDDTYLVKVINVEMSKMGIVRLMISNNDRGNFKFFATNKLDCSEAQMLKIYCRRWDIEVWHREGKADYGIKECRLRGDNGVSKYLTLSCCASTFLEIVTLLSPMLGVLRRKVGTPGLKRHFVLFDLLKSFISFIQRSGKECYEMILEAILYPYRSTKVKRLKIV